MNCVADPVADDGSESDEAPAPVRKCTGRRSEEWKILTATEGTRQTAQEALTDILRMQSETFGFAQHPSGNEVRTQEALIGKGIDSCRSRGGGADM